MDQTVIQKTWKTKHNSTLYLCMISLILILLIIFLNFRIDCFLVCFNLIIRKNPIMIIWNIAEFLKHFYVHPCQINDACKWIALLINICLYWLWIITVALFLIKQYTPFSGNFRPAGLGFFVLFCFWKIIASLCIYVFYGHYFCHLNTWICFI